MESVALSRQPNKVSVKKINGDTDNGAFSAKKTLYDDVYGGSKTTLSPRFEDYSEIFSTFHAPRASSIPVLDLPAVDDADVFFDFRSAGFDYSEVFRGFNGSDFSVSFEELFRQPNEPNGVSEDEEAAWTPVETDSLSGDSDHFGNNQGRSNGDLFQSVDGTTQLHTIPGFKHVFDETTRLHRTEPSLQVVDDIDLDMEFHADKVMRKHPRKTVSHVGNFASGEQTLSSGLNVLDGGRGNGSHSSETFVTVSGISLRTLPSQVPPPSRPPPPLDDRKGYTSGFHSYSERVDSEDTPGDSSLPVSDVEVDINSSAAAMKEPLHRPEAKLRSAKELERKKGFEPNVKSSYDVMNNDSKISENVNSFNDERIQATHDWRSGKMKISATDERQKARKTYPETLKPLEGERLLNMIEEKQVKESRSCQESDRITRVGMWREATEFFELVGAEKSGNLIHPISHTNRQREHAKKDKMAEIPGQEENEKTSMVHQHGKTENKVHKAYRSGSLEDVSETRHKEHQQVESKKAKEADGPTLNEVQWSMKLEENGKKVIDDEEQQLAVKRHKQSKKVHENGKVQREAFALGAIGSKGKVKGFVELEEICEMSSEASKLDNPVEKEACERECEIIVKQAKFQNKEGPKEACESEEIEKIQKVAFKKEESDEGLKQTHGKVESEMRLKEDFELDMDDKITKESFEEGESEACERDQGKEKFTEVCNGYGKGNSLQEADDSEGIQNVVKNAPELEKNSENIAQRKKEMENPSNPAFMEGNVDISNEDSCSELYEKILKESSKKEKDNVLDKALEGNGEGNGEGINMKFAKETDVALEAESAEDLLAAQSPSIHDEKIGKLEVSWELIADQEIGITRTGCKIGEKKLEEIAVENLMANGEKRASEMAGGVSEHSGREPAEVGFSVTNADELGRSGEQTCTEKIKTVPQMDFVPKSQERKVAHEWGGSVKITRHVEDAIFPEESRDQSSPSQASLCGGYRRKRLVDEPQIVEEVVNAHKTSKDFNLAQSTKVKGKGLNEVPASIEKDAERMRRERELEKDRLKKMEEEMGREREREKDRMAVDRAMLEAEREREREKDRMAVDRTTFEARDRMFAEAREKAERAAFEKATAEARQRALSEARERLEKACAEARDKSYADKATAEARLKAERAAVERATAEARERAMEKVKVERAVFESKERLERSVSDKFGIYFRNDGRQASLSSDVSSSTGSRYAYSSVHGASSFSGRSEGGESAQRCRARLERYRRTAERAAKALEEKNMRDQLAQKEQAERNRLAETLDAEVRRWSSGKEGNLRALLSTLQYILGPDSGWQPIPLTEVITSAAVKKAYRKATLCVHPDKLQQRGASIQHKYICEKVFDLLKEAWNKFNSEER
ncbi:hypothetical protein RIF29_33647 [Crotalaria pallida]|uniref:J domain-containing protein n=1 Tax=Crotalaria pallida TaxID=3830 RepID=A0AAN9E979_CROPI